VTTFQVGERGRWGVSTSRRGERKRAAHGSDNRGGDALIGGGMA
jgi:hypothetical protein